MLSCVLLAGTAIHYVLKLNLQCRWELDGIGRHCIETNVTSLYPVSYSLDSLARGAPGGI